MLLLPAELQAGGPERTLAALTDPGQRAALLAGDKLTDGFLGHVRLGCLPPDSAHLAGQSVAEAARSSGQPAGEWVLDLLVSADLQVGGHLHRPGLTEEDLAWIASDDRHAAGSDGIYQGQHPHPRAYGAFARLAEQYLAGGAATGPQRLARHLAANAADAFALSGRGRLRPAWPPTSASSGPPGSPTRPATTRRGGWRAGWTWSWSTGSSPGATASR